MLGIKFIFICIITVANLNILKYCGNSIWQQHCSLTNSVHHMLTKMLRAKSTSLRVYKANCRSLTYIFNPFGVQTWVLFRIWETILIRLNLVFVKNRPYNLQYTLNICITVSSSVYQKIQEKYGILLQCLSSKHISKVFFTSGMQ